MCVCVCVCGGEEERIETGQLPPKPLTLTVKVLLDTPVEEPDNHSQAKHRHGHDVELHTVRREED